MWSAWLPPVAYVGMIFYLSSIPRLAPPVDLDHVDKLAHFLEYGGLGLLLFRAAWLTRPPHARRSVWVLTLGIGALIAGMDEVFQGTVGRSRSAWDWGADVCGLAAASYIAHRVGAGSLRFAGKRAHPAGRGSEAAGNPEP